MRIIAKAFVISYCMKVWVKKLLKILPYVFLAAVLILVPILVFPCLKKSEQTPKQDYSGLVNMWHIENFEGGSFNRYQYLLRQMIELEKKHKGLLVSIKTLTATEARNLVDQGHLPDLVSFGTGTGDIFLDYAVSYRGKLNIREDFIASGTVGDEVKAVAYMTGGYFVLCNNNFMKEASIDTKANLLDNIYKAGYTYNKGKSIRYSVVTARENNLPLAAVLKNTSQTSIENSILWAPNQFEAYNSFVSGAACMLLGTQRDLHRVLNRISQNNFFEFEVQFLQGYTDLVQYVAITSKDQNTQAKVQLIIEYLTSESAQRSLTSVGMFGVDGTKCYTGQLLKDMEAALQSSLVIPNAFISSKKLDSLHELTISATKGNQETRNEIKSQLGI